MGNNPTIVDLEIVVYHCFSCDKDLQNIETAKEHSTSLCQEVTEETQRFSIDDQLL